MPHRLATIPAFPPVVLQLLRILADDNSSLAGIAACVATDPTFSGRILKRANAADIVRNSPASNVRDALVALGMERTRELTLTTAATAYMGSALKEEQLRRCWRHTVACAMAAAEIARACDIDAAEPYTAGLLHDIGRLGLLTAYPREYEQTMVHAREHSIDLIDYERERFGVDHAGAGQWLANRWGLPESLALVAGRHHDAPSGAVDLLVIVQVACQLADLLGFWVSESDTLPDFERIAAVLPEHARNRLRARLANLEADITGRIEYFGHVDRREPNRRLLVENTEHDDFGVELPASSSAPHEQSLNQLWFAFTAAAVLALLALVALRVWR